MSDLTVTETAARLGIHPNTLRAYADMGEISYIRLPGGHRRFTEDAITDFQKRHRGGPPRCSKCDELIGDEAYGISEDGKEILHSRCANGTAV